MPDTQAKNKYSDETIKALEQSLSTDRLSSYMLSAAGDKHEAILLHEYNTKISEALYGVIQGLEIALRNAIHRTLQNGVGLADWFDHIALKDPETQTLQFAKQTIMSRKKLVTPPRIVAQLNFGFWVRLISGDYEKSLWVPHLYKIFPEKTKRNKLNSRLNKIKDLRNKIAHHERITERDLDQDYKQILETIKWVCPLTSDWVEGSNRYKKPSPASTTSPAASSSELSQPSQQSQSSV